MENKIKILKYSNTNVLRFTPPHASWELLKKGGWANALTSRKGAVGNPLLRRWVYG